MAWQKDDKRNYFSEAYSKFCGINRHILAAYLLVLFDIMVSMQYVVHADAQWPFGTAVNIIFIRTDKIYTNATLVK